MNPLIQNSERLRCSSKRILIVEDDADVREGLEELFTLLDFEVATANHGLEALTYLRSNDAPCVILLDLMMPVMNGMQFREEQLKDPVLSEIPTLVLSAMDDGHKKAEVLKAKGFLRKPLNMEKLIDTVKNFC